MFIVALPFGVLHGGYWGIIAMVGIAHICCHTGKILIECLYEPEEPGQVCEPKKIRFSYKEIAQAVFGGTVGGYLVLTAQMIELLMTCILYVVLCGDLMMGAFNRGKYYFHTKLIPKFLSSLFTYLLLIRLQDPLILDLT